jgi:CrcB protein
MDFIWVAVGGACGAVCRYGVGILVVDRVASRFPVATLLVNVSGCLAIGLLVVALSERLVADPAWRLLLVVGFLGGYTTFSSYTLETVALVEAGRWHSAAAYVISSNGLGLLATCSGMLIARAIAR